MKVNSLSVPVVLKVVNAVSGGRCDYSFRASIILAKPLIVCELCLLFFYPSAYSWYLVGNIMLNCFQYVSAPLLSGLSVYQWLWHDQTVNYVHTTFICVAP